MKRFHRIYSYLREIIFLTGKNLGVKIMVLICLFCENFDFYQVLERVSQGDEF